MSADAPAAGPVTSGVEQPPDRPRERRPWALPLAVALVRATIGLRRPVAGAWARTAADLRGAFGHVVAYRHAGKVAAGVALVAYLLSGLYVVNPGEEAVVRRFGQVVNPRVTGGLRYRLPWPIERADVVNVAQIRREGIGATIPEHSPTVHPPEDVQVLTGDENVVSVKLIAQYRVKDPADYLLRVGYNPDPLVRGAVRDALITLAGQTTVDDLLTTGRPDLQQALQVQAQRTLDRYQSGLQFVNITLQEVSAPKEVADSFRDVASAREDRARAINEAEGYRNSVVPEARGKAQRALREAEAYRADAINRAGGEATRFIDTLAEYNRSQAAGAEDVTRYRLYVEAMEKVLPKVRKYVVDAAKSGERVTLRILEPR